LWSRRIKMRWRWRWTRWNWRTMSSILNFFIYGSTILQLAVYGQRILLSACGDCIMLHRMADGLWNAYNPSLKISAQKFKLFLSAA
jgi:hypothetical protein